MSERFYPNTMIPHQRQADSQADPKCATGDRCRYASELSQLQQTIVLLSEQVRTDALTGLNNFRYFSEMLPLEMERTLRSGQTMSLILLDIDHFKQFNDHWGHELGNQALKHVAKLITQALRRLDLGCRFGGEEFIIILPDTDLAQAIGVAERLREVIAHTPLKIDAEAVFLTASLGVDEFKHQQSDSPESLLQRVDTWLYQAKRSGRNCVASPELQDSVAVNTAEKTALFDLWRDDE